MMKERVYILKAAAGLLGWSLSLKGSPVIRNSTSKRDLQLEQLQTLHTAFLDAEEGACWSQGPHPAVNGWPGS